MVNNGRAKGRANRGGRGGGGGRGRGRGNGGYRSIGGGLDYNDVQTLDSRYSYSMWDEAKNTEQHASQRSATTRLRDNRVSFIQSGILKPNELLESHEPPKPTGEVPAFPHIEDSSGDPTTDQEAEAEAEVSTVEVQAKVENIDLGAPDPTENEEPQTFMFDFIGDESQAPNTQKPVQIPSRRDSTSPSSENEVIVFVPKKQRHNLVSTPQEPSKALETPLENRHNPVLPIEVITKETIITVEEPVAIKNISSNSFSKQPKDQDDSFISLKRESHRSKYSKKDMSAIDDYIENTKAEELLPQFPRDLGCGATTSDETDTEDAASDSDAIGDMKEDIYTAESRAEDFNDVDTDEESLMGPVKKIHRTRVRPSGLQCLVEWGNDFSASWIIATRLPINAIPIFQEFLKNTGYTNGEDGEEKEGEKDQAEEEEEDEDAKLARLRAFVERRPQYPDQSGHFPSATETAKFYEEFDLMDWERPSIALSCRGKKGKTQMLKTQLDYISDDNLRGTIEAAWNNDREKKKSRKARREELREQGLLTCKTKSGKAQMDSQYKPGMAMNILFEEIREFMCSPHTTLPLFPMDKEARKVIHEVASKLLLKSKSVGKGNSRRPILVKTSRTSQFPITQEAFDDILRRSKALPRGPRGPRGGTSGKAPKAKGGAKNGSSAHRYEGEQVGANAPELADDNIGRIMLEKMGFKDGMTLGAEGNKGISQPILAVVKRARTGIGHTY